jgi:predicted AlkP superfamily pyrophosphatase or phosphodiesterase
MNVSRLVLAGAAVALTLSPNYGMAADTNTMGSKNVKHVLLLSIDGMHAVDFYNCSHGIAGANSGEPYCPNLAALGKTGINYVATSSSKPSDSAPGLMALVTGGTPRTTGIYYDVAFDRRLDGPEITTGTGLAAAPCTPNASPAGTTTDND